MEEANSSPMNEITSQLDAANESDHVESEEENERAEGEEHERIQKDDEWIKG